MNKYLLFIFYERNPNAKKIFAQGNR